MPVPRRTLVIAGGAAALGGAAAWQLWPAVAPAAAQGPGPGPAPGTPVPPAAAPANPADAGGSPRTDPRLAERFAGRAEAPLVVQEFFSLTCGHCAAFHTGTWPQVKAELVDTGRIRFVWNDFPLDEVALSAAMVARALPALRYEAFISTLFQNQNRWAFAQGQQIDELARMAALAGMNRAEFDRTLADEGLKRGVLEARLAAQNRWQIRATPSFAFGSRLVSGNLTFAEFRTQAERGGRA
ncbi:MAG: thioredoxin domain-containing protein [Rubritepida sp.]|nr:thioredoxin domain-containing protein [Rubritepida sp.]